MRERTGSEGAAAGATEAGSAAAGSAAAGAAAVGAAPLGLGVLAAACVSERSLLQPSNMMASTTPRFPRWWSRSRLRTFMAGKVAQWLARGQRASPAHCASYRAMTASCSDYRALYVGRQEARLALRVFLELVGGHCRVARRAPLTQGRELGIT